MYRRHNTTAIMDDCFYVFSRGTLALLIALIYNIRYLIHLYSRIDRM